MLKVTKFSNPFYLLVVLLIYSLNSYGIEVLEKEFAPIQMNNSTCQSYALAVALHLIDTRGQYSIESDIESIIEIKLRSMEEKIRDLILQEMSVRGVNISNHTDWAKAIKKFTNGRYTVSNRSFVGEQKFYKYILKHFAKSPACYVESGKCVFKNKLSSILSPAILLSSIASAEKYTYRSGHIVGIVDIGKEYILKPELKIINSSNERSANSCTPLHGSVSWISNYQPKIIWHTVNKTPVFNLAWITSTTN